MCCSAHLPHPSKSIKAQLRPQKKRSRRETISPTLRKLLQRKACNKKSILNRWTVPSTSYGSDSLPGMKTPTIPWVPPAVGGDAHRSFCSGSSPSQMGKTRPTDWDGLRWIATEIPWFGKSDFQSEITLLENKTTKTCLPLKTNDKAGRLPFFSSQTCLSANVQKFKSQMPHNRRHKSSVPSQL